MTTTTRRATPAPPRAGGAVILGRKLEAAAALRQWRTWRARYKEATTVHTQGMMLRAWLRGARLTSTPVSALTHRHVDAWVNTKEKKSVATRHARLNAAKSFLKFCTESGYAAGNPAALVEVRLKGLPIEQKIPKAKRAITPDEYARILAFLDAQCARPPAVRRNPLLPFLRAAVVFSYWTGLRLSDCAQLEWLCFQPREIFVFTDKDEELLGLPLGNPLIGSTDLMLTLLQLQGDRDPSSSLSALPSSRFVFPAARAIILDPARRQLFSTAFKRMFVRAGVTGATFHSVRHAFVKRLRDAGVSEKEIGRLVGHSDLKTTAGYGTK